MKKQNRGDLFYSDLKPIVQGLGYDLVELKQHIVKGVLHISLVIYKKDGVGIDDCSEVHNAVLSRIEIIEDSRDIHLEVSSPGVNRTLKTVDEFTVFMDNWIKVMRKGASDWIRGTILDADENSVTLKNEETTFTVPFESIQKAKLDYSLGGQR